MNIQGLERRGRHQSLGMVLLTLALFCAASFAVQAGPSAYEEQMAWAKENLDAGRYAEAVVLYLAAHREAADEGQKQLASGLALIKTLRIVGKYKEAIELCEGLLKTRTGDLDLNCLRAELLAEVGRYTDAM